MEEVAVIMGIEYADTNTPGWFNHRTAAAKTIIENMSETEKRNLRTTAQELSDKGFPAELQRK